MNEITKKSIESHVSRILEDFSFEFRKKRCLEECPCYATGKPCHEIPNGNFNCFLCYCPEYDTGSIEGRCKIGNPQKKGKWFYHASHPTGRIWDCSNCTFPNEKSNVRKYLNRIFGLKD